jgi:hypothetical protein
MSTRKTSAVAKSVAALFAGGVLAGALALAQPPPTQRGPTLDERVESLERGFASLSTRFELRDSALPSAPGGSLEPRIADLERSLDRLVTDLQRLERQVDNAYREATDARREAMNAERAARDAQMRVR